MKKMFCQVCFFGEALDKIHFSCYHYLYEKAMTERVAEVRVVREKESYAAISFHFALGEDHSRAVCDE